MFYEGLIASVFIVGVDELNSVLLKYTLIGCVCLFSFFFLVYKRSVNLVLHSVFLLGFFVCLITLFVRLGDYYPHGVVASEEAFNHVQGMYKVLDGQAKIDFEGLIIVLNEDGYFSEADYAVALEYYDNLVKCGSGA